MVPNDIIYCINHVPAIKFDDQILMIFFVWRRIYQDMLGDCSEAFQVLVIVSIFIIRVCNMLSGHEKCNCVCIIWNWYRVGSFLHGFHIKATSISSIFFFLILILNLACPIV